MGRGEGRGRLEGATRRIICAGTHLRGWVNTPGQRLEEFAALDADGFIEEVRKRRPKSAGRLSPAALRDLRDGYKEQAVPVQKLGEEASSLERRIGELVNEAYGLTPEEVELMWATAPPRMPRF